jgi:two-component system cell cycle sensor histidine kinase/response regulator CckA
MNEPQATPSSSVAPTVLVVDDDHPLLEMASRILSGAGYDVVVAHNGVDALDQARTMDRIDLVFTDIFMPGLTGLELTEALGRERPTVPVLLTTGQFTDDVQAAVRLTGHPLLVKPYTAPDLRQAAEAALAAAHVASTDTDPEGPS